MKFYIRSIIRHSAVIAGGIAGQNVKEARVDFEVEAKDKTAGPGKAGPDAEAAAVIEVRVSGRKTAGK